MHRALPKKVSLQRRFVNKIIFAVAAIQPLATIPQITAIFSTRNATGVSITSWVIFVVFDLVWLWYGLDEKEKAVIVSAILFAALDAVVMIGGLWYGGRW